MIWNSPVCMIIITSECGLNLNIVEKVPLKTVKIKISNTNRNSMLL